MPETTKASGLDAPIRQLVSIVMKNSGGSANPVVVERVILALRGERVSFVDTRAPRDD